MQRLAALVPRPRLHLIRLHGVLAPNAKLRAPNAEASLAAMATPPMKSHFTITPRWPPGALRKPALGNLHA